MLVPKGEKRGRYYIASPWLREIREKTRETKKGTDPFTDDVVTVSPKDQAFLPGFEP